MNRLSSGIPRFQPWEDVKLSRSQIERLDELYVPHALVGVMAQNKPGSSPFASTKTDMKNLEKEGR